MSGLLIDCFAGGGGASKGIELALNRPIDIAVNHMGGSGDRPLPAVDGKPPPLWPRHPGGQSERADHLQGCHHHRHPAERLQHQNLRRP